MTMGMILKLQRVRAKKTLRQVSKESGVATATVQRIESGQGADWDSVAKVSRALKISLDDLADAWLAQ